MTFTTGKAVAKAVWDLKYMVDMASKRKLIGFPLEHDSARALSCSLIRTHSLRSPERAQQQYMCCDILVKFALRTASNF